MTQELNSQQRAHLRGMAMNLKPVVSLGKQGLTDTALRELDLALTRDELIKIRVAGDRDARAAMLAAVAEATGATLCGAVGGTASLYRQSPAHKISL